MNKLICYGVSAVPMGGKDEIGILEKGQNSLKEFSHNALIFVDFMS